jgi:hypothetical protein
VQKELLNIEHTGRKCDDGKAEKEGRELGKDWLKE